MPRKHLTYYLVEYKSLCDVTPVWLWYTQIDEDEQCQEYYQTDGCKEGIGEKHHYETTDDTN